MEAGQSYLTPEAVAAAVRTNVGEMIAMLEIQDGGCLVVAHRELAPCGPEKAWSTHYVYWNDAGAGVQEGHYDMTREEAMEDLVSRAGLGAVQTTELPEETQILVRFACQDKAAWLADMAHKRASSQLPDQAQKYREQAQLLDMLCDDLRLGMKLSTD